MKIRFGYDMSFHCAVSVPMLAMLRARPSASQQLLAADRLLFDPHCSAETYQDGFGNVVTRFTCPPGTLRMRGQGVLEDSGLPERAARGAAEVPVAALPADALQFLIGSRYCETEPLMSEAWRLFGHIAPGWARVQAICDFVHDHVTFGYEFARPTKTAYDTYHERRGVCRDFAHLAITFCRCLNIPARYCTGYLGDIGVPPVDAPMDFAASMEAYLGGQWYTFDPRNGTRRIGRILVAQGRDAADVALTTAFGNAALQSFSVHTEQISDQQALALVRDPLAVAA